MIIVTGDCHGHHDYLKFNNLDKSPDYIIVAGDFGVPWSNSVSDYWDQTLTEYYNNLGPIILVTPGNHENYKRIFSMPLVDIGIGDLVYKFTDKIFFMQRGHLYNIEGKSILSIGGALSTDKTTNPNRVQDLGWWSEELLSYSEEHYCLDLLSTNPHIDYVISHTAPKWIVEKMVYRRWADLDRLRDPVCEFLNVVDSLLRDKISGWHFGHFHEDKEINDIYHCHYYGFEELI